MPRNSNYEHGETVVITLNQLSPAVVEKIHDTDEMGRWILINILGKQNKKMIICICIDYVNKMYNKWDPIMDDNTK